MTRGRPRSTEARPDRCPAGHAGTIQLAGRRTSSAGRLARSRFLCVPDTGPPHKFTLPRRQPSHQHPLGQACPSCEADIGRTTGPVMPTWFQQSAAEAARVLLEVGTGTSMRKAARSVRFDADRFTPGPAGIRRASTEAALAMRYLDHFGPAVLARVEPERWPRILVLDARDLRLRAWGTEQLLGDDLGTGGVLLAAAGRDDPTVRSTPAWRFGLAGDKSAASWFDFLGELPGEPDYVVCDRDKAIVDAVVARWPGVVIFHCAWHIRQNLLALSKNDGIPTTSGPVFEAIRRAQTSEEAWADLKHIAREREAVTLLDGIRGLDPLVRSQLRLRQQFPDHPHGNGPAEHAIDAVAGWLDDRRLNYRNSGRLRIVLGLARAHLAGQADANTYTSIIRERMRALASGAGPGEPRFDWGEHADHGASTRQPLTTLPSVSQLIADARLRGAGDLRSSNNDAKARSVLLKLRRENELRADQGLPPLGHRIAPAGTASVVVAGLRLADFPSLLPEWDEQRNGGPGADMPAGSGRTVHWLCAQGHSWTTPVSARTTRLLACRACLKKWTTEEQSFAHVWPDLLAEWDPENRRDPAAIAHDYDRETVSWLCLKDQEHGTYRMSPMARSSKAIGCPTCRAAATQRSRKRRAAAEARGGVSLGYLDERDGDDTEGSA